MYENFTEPDNFETWLISMNDFLDRIHGLIDELNDSLGSLNTIEAWILQRFANTEEMLETSASSTVNELGCCIGETIRRQCDGQWDIILDEPDNVFTDYQYCGRPIRLNAQ